MNGTRINQSISKNYLTKKMKCTGKASRFIFQMLVETNVKGQSNVKSKWMEELNVEIDEYYWSECFCLICQCTISSIKRIFKYKLSRRILFTNYRLY